ncbi:uncharacterized protein EHS24_007670 [Apiotrichum porosum]|uniref:ABC1 atypical kinase-like domain-containing protein n=1 Tax=Apiotrichum porosum TaxID=105984 RepID=A0A427XUP7_9TREE|nr:uncharacterized protein EHS24_007670 [Apiotrichum porosum]RSH82676.1 hypothetical protein EHS24_007670 [Apiotrichum porosum]
MPVLTGRSVSKLAVGRITCQSARLLSSRSLSCASPELASRFRQVSRPRLHPTVQQQPIRPFQFAYLNHSKFIPQRPLTTLATRATVAPKDGLRTRPSRRLKYALAILVVLAVLYNTYAPFRHTTLAIVRCARLMRAVILDVWDYKQTFAHEERLGLSGEALTLTVEQRARRRELRKACHLRSAQRMLEALKKNSGVYVKIGQHVAAVQVLPKEWTSTMTPLQDQCFPTPVQDIDAMLREDLGLGIDDLFVDFDAHPIGVASLAQVHRAVDRRTGLPVAVKVQHADLQEFAMIDLATVNVAISFVKHIFPDFEFGWLGEEMNEMLPLEMNFRHEAANSQRCLQDFEPLKGKTSLYLPEVMWAERRCLVMEYIDGGRVDDLAYLKRHKIDRNQVSQELSRIFSQMVYINGFFHADPHHGNLLVRPRAANSTSPFNFDVCLLDHGQYFDIPDDLRVNYAHFWLALMTPASEKTIRTRKHYARLVGNIDEEMVSSWDKVRLADKKQYPYLESAITGRVSMDDAEGGLGSSLLDTGSASDSNTDQEQLAKLRAVVLDREGLLLGIFELLRRVPRRLLMILKLSDLQRSLDYSLSTTHGQHRVYIIIGRYCATSVWQADKLNLRRAYEATGLSLSLFKDLAKSWFTYTYYNTFFGVIELGMDVGARVRKVGLWVHGLRMGGFDAAFQEMAGLKATA